MTGVQAFAAKTPVALIYLHIFAGIPRLPQAISQYQPMIDRALAKQADDRYQTAMEFIQVLESAEQGDY